MAAKGLMLSPPERRELSRRLRSRRVRSEDARRADVILRSARGQSMREIAGALGCSTSYVERCGLTPRVRHFITEVLRVR